MKQLTLGKKIRNLRLKKGMTQAQLAGETVTRNMLSQIENENALPSVNTILEISERLEVPAEYFFSEMNDPAPFYKMQAIERIRKMYGSGEYVRCMHRIERLDVWDDETEYLYAKSCLEKAKEFYHAGKLTTAAELLERALIHAEKTVYLSEDFEGVVCRYRKAIQTVRKKENTETEETKKCGIGDFLEDVMYPSLICEEPNAVWFLEKDSPYAKHLALHREIQKENPEEAEALKDELRVLLETVKEEEAAVLKYYILCDLEYLAQKTGDYKCAYECSVGKLALSEKMNG